MDDVIGRHRRGPWESGCEEAHRLCHFGINHPKSVIRNEIFANIYIIQTLKKIANRIEFELVGRGAVVVRALCHGEGLER